MGLVFAILVIAILIWVIAKQMDAIKNGMANITKPRATPY